MLNAIGRVSAVVALVGGALLANATDAGAVTGVRPCTNEEYEATCAFATGSGYYDSWQELWYCPSSYTCLWDDSDNRPVGFVNYDSQLDPCPTNLPCI